MKKRRAGEYVGGLSLALVAVAYIPSAAAFTPAILLTFIGFIGGIIAAFLGALRLAVVTLFLAGATFIVSTHSFTGLARVEYLMLAFAVVAIALALFLFRQYQRKSSQR